jgi:hypothetical protein
MSLHTADSISAWSHAPSRMWRNAHRPGSELGRVGSQLPRSDVCRPLPSAAIIDDHGIPRKQCEETFDVTPRVALEVALDGGRSINSSGSQSGQFSLETKVYGWRVAGEWGHSTEVTDGAFMGQWDNG